MATGFMMLFFFAVMGGGATDLLDLVPTDEYWRAKNVQVTPELIAAELAEPAPPGDLSKLINQLGDEDPANREKAAAAIRKIGMPAVQSLRDIGLKSDDPEIVGQTKKLLQILTTSNKAEQVRRLMAIRSAGDMKLKALSPRLQQLSKSDDPFVSDYAAAALAAIDGKPYTRPHQSAAEETWRLPKDCTAVVHLASRGGKPATVEEQKKAIALMQNSGFGATGDPAQTETMFREQVAQIIKVADTAGNIRLDGISLGLSSNVGPRSGYVVIMAHGIFDAQAIHAMAAEMLGGRADVSAFEGVNAIREGKDTTLLFPNNRTALMIGGPAPAVGAASELVAAFKKDQFPLKGNETIQLLARKVDTAGPIWGVIKLVDFMRQGPMAGVDWATLTSKAIDGQGLSFTLTAKGRNADEMTKLAGVVTEGLASVRADLKRAVDEKQVPPQMADLMAPMRKLLDSLKIQVDPADGTMVQMTGAADLGPTHLFGFAMMGMYSVRSPGPPAQVAPAPPAPAPRP